MKRKLHAALAAGRGLRVERPARWNGCIPEDLPPASIEPRLGAVWIPAESVEAFIREVLELRGAAVQYLAKAGTWSVQVDKYEAQGNVTCSQEFGTSRMNAIELVLCALNVQMPTVRDPHPERDTYVVNKPTRRWRRARSWACSRSASRPGPSRTRSAARGCAGSTTTCSTLRASASSTART